MSVAGPSHPDGAVVDQPELTLAPGEVVLVEAELDAASGRVTRVLPHDPRGRDVPPLWFVEQDQQDADPPAQVLVAFATDEVPAGTVVPVDDFARLAADVSDQVAAIRWFPRTGEVHQVYVQPALRRRGLGLAMCLAAGSCAVVRGWPSVRSGGARTDLGEAFAVALPGPVRLRVSPRTGRAHDMTPPERAVGVPARNLVPDRPV